MHPIVQKFLDQQLPEPMVGALLGGALPLPPLDLLQALAHAVFQEGPLTPKALETLQGIPESLLASAIIGPVDPPAPLGLILIHRRESGLTESALLHEDLTAEWMERVIPSLPGKALEIPLHNQVLWIERPMILDLLEAHPEADYGIKRKVEEFRRDVLKQISQELAQERLEIIDEVEAGNLDRAWAELPPPKPEELAEELDPAVLRESLIKPVVDEEGHEIPLRLTQRIMKLRTSQKILLAQKGGKEERTLLIRESNRLIQVAVIRNGRITEGEVAYIAQMRSVHDEILRIISLNREWMKKYNTVKNLVMNPRTPLPISLNMLKRFTEYDLKLVLKDRNVAELLRREAKRMLEK
ncbi:hypothetical protein [Holophaga foetida]|uniref:hypothetical protein n=1 Tax=Holophaga foetida TaxID=35839 RepID=UPI0002475358|nr:hypothetical protein [Holophaga foetida]